jgi:hypothetical protein
MSTVIETEQSRGRPKKWSDSQLLAALELCANQINDSPTFEDYQSWRGGFGFEVPEAGTFSDQLGSWNKAKEKAGLETRESNHNRREPDVKIQTSGGGYEEIRVKTGDGWRHFQHHRLIAASMSDEPLSELDGKHVHHRDGVTWNNSENNLEILTPAEHLQLHREDN